MNENKDAKNPAAKAQPGKAVPLARILLVDDDQIILDSLGGFLRSEGYEVTVASSTAGALDCLRAGQFNLVITDLFKQQSTSRPVQAAGSSEAQAISESRNMPNSDGFELLRQIKAARYQAVVIMMTAYGTIESAIEAIKQGAYDYLNKPIIEEDVRLSVQRALQQQQLLAENSQLKAALVDRFSFANIIGQDYRMSKVFELIEAVADTRTTILITGESGTGKSLIARAIHARSSRQAKPFVEVSCGAIPDTLLESELFGHVRGSFTGAVADKQGKFAAADGGTLFLDEISTASPSLQVKLLRVLQERQFEPVGSNQTREVDVRVILATNHNMEQEVKAGRFRSDLYYRINVVNIELPPLRERLADIPLLAEHFLRKYDDAGRLRGGIAAEAVAVLQRYAWPGNVRELENCMERAVVLCRRNRIAVEDLPPALAQGPTSVEQTEIDVGNGPFPSLQEALAGPEKQIIFRTLKANKGSRQLTAAQLGINRCTLYKKMRKYGLLGEA